MKQSKQSVEESTKQAATQPTSKLKLRKNHGKTSHGRDCKFYVAGTEFDRVEDAELIASLVQSGAQLDE
jgi:hypothetical protein